MPFFIHADLLYWQAQVNSLDSAITQKGEFVQPHFDWDPGFRITLGQETKHDVWDYSLTFTHIHTKARRSIDSEGMVPFWLDPRCLNGSPDDLDERWRLHLGLLDLDLGKKVPVTSFLSFRPHIGVRYAEIRQKYHIDFSGGTLAPLGNEIFSSKNKFWGVGPRIGSEIFFKITKRFGIYQELALSLLYGKFYIHENDRAKESHIQSRMYNQFVQAEPILEIPIGIFYEDRHWFVNAAYEIQFFFNQNQLIRFTNASHTGVILGNQGDLTLHGFTLGVGYRF